MADQSDTSSTTSGSNSTVVSSKIPQNLLKIHAALDIRRLLTNILLILFRYHPNGVFQSKLSSFRMMNTNLKYLLTTHRSIAITKTQHDLLYTLNPKEILNIYKSFKNSLIVQKYLIEHILRLFDFFPNGIASICFDETFEKISQYKLSDIVPYWYQFVLSIPFIICVKVRGFNVLVNTANSQTVNHFDCNKILTQSVGYKELFTNYCTYSNKQELEQSFLLNFKWKIRSESPYIANILNNMQIIHNINNKSPYSEDHCTVFMGGFSHKTSITELRYELDKIGFRVVKCTEFKYRKYGFTWVTLSNANEADYLIQISPIKIMGNNIDIRPFINREKQKKIKPTNEIILRTMIKLVNNNKSNTTGLSIRDIQPILFNIFSYRISGTDLNDIVKENANCLCIKTDETGTQRICSCI